MTIVWSRIRGCIETQRARGTQLSSELVMSAGRAGRGPKSVSASLLPLVTSLPPTSSIVISIQTGGWPGTFAELV